MTRAEAHRMLWRVIIISTAIRLLLAAVTGLGVDESYSIGVARPLAWSYFDHPPLHLWIAGGVIALGDSTNALLVRLPFVLAFSGTLWAMGHLGIYLFGPRAGVLGAVALASTGVLGVTTGTWVLPDGPLVLASSLAALTAASLVVRTRAWAAAEEQARTGSEHDAHASTVTHVILRWSAVGALLAIALLSKYHAALMGAGMLLFLLTTPDGRRSLKTGGPWLAAGIALIGTVPILWWNASHQWASFRFQGGRAATSAAWSPAPLGEFILGQVAWLLPWVAIPAAVALYRAIRVGRADAAGWYCTMLSAVPIALFNGIAASGTRGLPHWTAPGWLFVMPLVGRLLDHSLTQASSWPVRWIRLAPAATAGLACVLASHVATGWLGGFVPALRAPQDPSLDALDWRPLADSLSARGLASHPVLARSWIQAGKLSVALGPEARVRCDCLDPRHFAFLPSVSDTHRALVIEVAQPWKRSWVAAADQRREHNKGLSEPDTIVIPRWGKPAVRLLVYHPLP